MKILFSKPKNPRLLAVDIERTLGFGLSLALIEDRMGFLGLSDLQRFTMHPETITIEIPVILDFRLLKKRLGQHQDLIELIYEMGQAQGFWRKKDHTFPSPMDLYEDCLEIKNISVHKPLSYLVDP